MTNARSTNVDSPVYKFGPCRPHGMFLHALRNPCSVGAVAAASPQLVNAVVSQVDERSEIVVELGAGTGVITHALLQQRNSRRGVVSIEIDPQLAEIVRTRLSDSEVIVGDALELASYFGEGQVDCIICSLPLTLLSSRDLHTLLDGARAVLKEGGMFVFYLYRLGIWRNRYRNVMRCMRDSFPDVSENKTVWRNLPPARVIVCR
jgi:phospholipid N-methyltransferase